MRAILMVFLLSSSFLISAQDISQFQSFLGYKYFVDAQPISKQEVEEMLMVYPEAISHWKRAKQANILAMSLLGAELGFGYWGIANAFQGKKVGGPFIGMLSAGIGSIIFSFRTRKLKQNALLTHNHLNNKVGLSFSAEGMGLQWNF